ncbi:efflux RND transporter periplasmic adaptor subunit [Candidatus Roizmanbacteria bacterium]|nr:efflux RND transporter periplasmic adaptor subunit [Candidatus Roizmanbacteria bacterium]
MIKFLKRRWYLVLIVIAVTLFIFIQNRKAATSAEKKLSTYKIKKETLKETLSLSGEIDAEEKAVLRFQTSGRLVWVGVKEGDIVNKYQTIATLDQRDIKNRLGKYLNTYAIQRNTFEQTKDDNWNDQYALGQPIRDEAKRILESNQHSLNNTVLDVEYQNLAVEYSNLWTPIEGVITKVSTPFAGVNITPAGSEFEIVNPKTVFLSVTAEQSDVVLLKEGMEGEIVFDAYPDKTFTGVIDFISFSPKTGETGTVYQVKLLLDEEGQKLPLKLAMTGDVEFILSEKRNVLAVPIQFVKKDDEGDYLMRERKGKREKIYVKRGEEFDSKVEIKNGVGVGDVVYD